MRHVPAVLFMTLASTAPSRVVAQREVGIVSIAGTAALRLDDMAAGRRARFWSLAATVAPLIAAPMLIGSGEEPSFAGMMLVSSAIYVGPAVGYWTEGASQRGWMGVGVRFGIVMGGATVASMLLPDHPMTDDEIRSPRSSMASLAFLAAAGGVMWSAVHDIRDAPRQVRRARQLHRLEREHSRISVAPAADLGERRAGLQARITF